MQWPHLGQLRSTVHELPPPLLLLLLLLLVVVVVVVVLMRRRKINAGEQWT